MSHFRNTKFHKTIVFFIKYERNVMEEKIRCQWCKQTELTIKYHDKEWGIPVHNDKIHFEYLALEVMQCGLNWTMILKKREILKKCFDDFDFNKISNKNFSSLI